MKFGTYRTGDGQFNNPIEITIDSSDTLFVTDDIFKFINILQYN